MSNDLFNGSKSKMLCIDVWIDMFYNLIKIYVKCNIEGGGVDIQKRKEGKKAQVNINSTDHAYG